MAQTPFSTRKESPEKDPRHASRPASSEEGGSTAEPSPGQLRAESSFPSSMAASAPQVFDDKTGVPLIHVVPGPGTTAKFTISDVIAHQQAEDAGQAPPKPDLPEDAVKKAKLLGIIEVSDEERKALHDEAAEESRARFAGVQRPATTAAVHPVAGAQHAGNIGAGVAKTPAESATQAKYDNR